MSKFTVFDLKEKEFKVIRDSITNIHPAYVLDDSFTKKLDKTKDEDLEKFINEQNDNSFKINFKYRGIKPFSPISKGASIYENYDYEIDNDDIAILSIDSFTEEPPEDFLDFCVDLAFKPRVGDIILDLRRNEGGKMEYIDQVIEALYGQDMFKYIQYQLYKDTKVLWRNSEQVQKILKERGSEVYNELLQTSSDIYVQEINPQKASRPENRLGNKNLYVLISQNCKKEVLTLLDYFEILILSHPTNDAHMTGHIYLVGEPTDFETNYSDSVTINQSKFTLNIPMKKYINRFRADGQRYYPYIGIEDLSVDKNGIKFRHS